MNLHKLIFLNGMNQASGLVKSFFNIIVSFHICSESSISVRRAYFMAVFDRRLTPHATSNSDNRLCPVASTLDLCLLLFTMCNVLFLVLFKVSNYTLRLMLGFSPVVSYLEALLCASDDGVYPRYDNVVGHPGPLSITASPQEETSRWVRR